jgi:hypothetical protein
LLMARRPFTFQEMMLVIRPSITNINENLYCLSFRFRDGGGFQK